MPRPVASVPPEAIRIEDEVWQEAFARREPPSSRRLQAIDGGRSASAPAPVAPTRAPVPAQVTSPPPEPATTPGDELLLPSAPLAWQDGPSANAIGGVPGRKTVTIRGYGAERNLGWPDRTRPRPQRRAYERADFKPDRVAMWAVLLGILLVIVAVASAHA